MSTNTNTKNIDAMLVGLRLRAFPNQRTDKQVTAEVQEARNIPADAGEWRRFKLPPATLEPVLKLHRKIRTWNYGITLRWEDSRQLLPMTKYDAYMKEFDLWQSEVAKEVKAFTKAYPGYVAERKVAMNGDFIASDYPTDIAAFFSCDVLFYPLPDESHITSRFGKKIAAAMRDSVGTANQDRINEALADLWTRILTPVQHVVEKLAEQKPLFRDSMIENVQLMLAEAPDFDFMKSPEVATALKLIKTQIADIKPDTLRTDKDKAVEVMSNAAKIVSKFGTVAGRKLDL